MVAGEIIKTIIRSKWIIPVIVIGIIGLMSILFLSWRAPEVSPATFVVEDTSKELEMDIAAFYSASTDEELPVSDVETKAYISAEETVEYFFAMAKVGDIQLFPSVFMSEVFQEDFFQYDFSEREKKLNEAMQRLSRNGTLERVEIIRDLWVLQKDSTRIVVDLYYKDLPEPKRINLMLKHIEQAPPNQTGNGMLLDVFFITTSVWEIIDHIEKE